MVEIVPETRMQGLIREAIVRFGRYRTRQLQRTYWTVDPLMSEQHEARAKWFDARRKYLEEEYKRHGQN